MFKPHFGNCVHPDCKRPEGALLVVKKLWCGPCNYTEKQKAKGDKAKKPYMAPLSDKRAKEQRIYTVTRKLFLVHHPRCEINITGICTGQSTDIHHSYSGKDRSKYFLDQSTWFATDRACHNWIHSNPIEAREKGFLK